MKKLPINFLLLAAGHVAAAPSFTQAWPSCDIRAQHDVKGETGGSIRDTLQAHISVRVNVLQADIGNARKARHLSETQSEQLWHHADRVRKNVDGDVKSHGFLSAPERASYDREIDDIASKLCRAVK